MLDREKNQELNNDAMHDKLIEYIDLINVQFREPASNIFATLPLLVNSINNQDTEKAIEGVQNVYQRTYFILKSINNISVIARLLGGNSFSKTIINFSDLVKNIFSSSEMVLPPYLKFDIEADDGCYIDGNNSLLTVAILNIILNSIDYRQDDDVSISVELKKDNGRCVLTYKDNSIGIKSELVQDVFNPFFTANPYNDGAPSTKMGVGLYIAKKAFEHAGGNVLMQTEFGEGVKYVVSLPYSTMDTDLAVKNYQRDLVLNRYSDVFIQLCEYCDLPEL